MLAECGDKCFGLPDKTHPKYPICPLGSCKPTCQGITAAKKRASRFRNYSKKRSRDDAVEALKRIISYEKTYCSK
jgi:hypothetical protein